MHTPPYPAALTAMPASAAAALAGTLAAGRPAAPRRQRRPGRVRRVRRRVERAHRRARPRLPPHAPAPPRRARPARPAPAGPAVVAGAGASRPVVAWYEAFAAEIDEPPGDLRPQVDDRLSHGGVTLWLVDGEPVSLAGTTRAVAGAARVAPVYTPPEHRGRGYGAGGDRRRHPRRARAGVDELLLYTDLANPTSNRLYARLGYRPVEDSVSLLFDG